MYFYYLSGLIIVLKYFNLIRFVQLLTLFFVITSSVYADKVNIAVASNFTAPMKAIIKQFQKTHPHQIKASFGSSGKIYAQIKHGAPYALFFSADKKMPLALEKDDLASSNTIFTYAVGALALWSSTLKDVDSPARIQQDDFNKLAIANPKLAPYGIAANEVLNKLNLSQSSRKKWVQGENIAQTYQFVGTGNADLGFVALSQVLSNQKQGSYWIVPHDLYNPIYQDAVLLKRYQENKGALAFWNYMQSAEAQSTIQSFGYSLPE